MLMHIHISTKTHFKKNRIAFSCIDCAQTDQSNQCLSVQTFYVYRHGWKWIETAMVQQFMSMHMTLAGGANTDNISMRCYGEIFNFVSL